jgi:tagaturonate epimerase
MQLAKFSMGIGDRFGRQGKAQLSAFVEAAREGAAISPVWNKSNREHRLIGTTPAQVRIEADAAVKAAGWKGPYHVDADHVGLATIDPFIAPSDFFTLDVADFIGKSAPGAEVSAFAKRMSRYEGLLEVPGIDGGLRLSKDEILHATERYLAAAREAGKIYRRILEVKAADSFIVEVSMDETADPQSPAELFLILAALAEEKIPVQTIAPKFPGRFNKGVDYVGDLVRFERNFDRELCVVAFAVKEFGLPAGLKLSVHSGSDKFSLYGPMAKAIARHGAGLHLKTAGTTWLEELIGLAESEGAALGLVKKIYAEAYGRMDELTAPYAEVIDIKRPALPSPGEFSAWSGPRVASAIRHEGDFDPNLRQLLHVSFKVAAEMGDAYLDALDGCEELVAKNVAKNLLERHIRPLFLGRA